MPNFITDADLLAYEPNVFNDLPFASQRTLQVTDAAVSGTTVTSATGGFDALSAGDVAIVADVAHAVASITDDNTLELTAAPVALSATTGLTLTARTLAAQATLVHGELMRAVGIDADDPDETLDESSIVSVGVMRRLEALGALSRAYAAAVALVGDNEAINAKAAAYRQRFAMALSGAQVLVDTDGDGRADVWRTPGVVRLTRV
ncbi:MAG: hypothetical protein GC159_14410 [Phycisphaera sp.]|nr:hypothetical protein [Phycisphaera sp.]